MISVEHPTKNYPIRSWKPHFDSESIWWKSLGQNQRCVTLDISSERGQKLAHDLVADAEVVLKNLRPGTMDGWKLG